jgi:hypothetical protein
MTPFAIFSLVLVSVSANPIQQTVLHLFRNHCFADFLFQRDDLPHLEHIKNIYVLSESERETCDFELKKLEKEFFDFKDNSRKTFKRMLKKQGNVECAVKKLKEFNIFQSLVKKMLFNTKNEYEAPYFEIDVVRRVEGFAEGINEVHLKEEIAQMFCNPEKIFGRKFDEFYCPPEMIEFFTGDDEMASDDLKNDFCLMKNVGEEYIHQYIFYNFKENPQKVNFKSLDCQEDFKESSKQLEVFLLKQLLESMENITRDQEICIRNTVSNNNDFARHSLEAEAAGKCKLNDERREELKTKFVAFMSGFFKKIEDCMS